MPYDQRIAQLLAQMPIEQVNMRRPDMPDLGMGDPLTTEINKRAGGFSGGMGRPRGIGDYANPQAPMGTVRPSTAPARRFAEPPPALQQALDAHARGQISAQDVQRAFKGSGWSVDLRRGRYENELFDPDGFAHYYQP